MRPTRNYRSSQGYRGHLRYRVGQFWAALRASPLSENELSLAKSALTGPQMALFSRLHPSEQAHSVRVLRYLLDQGESHPDLLAAALLHDIGKVCHPIRLWERIVIVLAKQVAPARVAYWGSGEPKGWKRPFVISCRHAEWGAKLVSQTSVSPLLIDLIREHQLGPPGQGQNDLKERLLAALYEADKQN